MSPRWSRSSMIRPAQVPRIGVPAAASVAQRLGQPLALDAQRHRGRLAAGDHEPVEPLQVGRHAHLAHLGAQPPQHARCAAKPPCRARTPIVSATALPAARRERAARSSSLRASSERHRVARGPRRPAATRAGSAKCVVASTIARGAAPPGPRDLKIPEPTKTPSAPSCITSEASAGVAIPPAQNMTTGSRPSRGDAADEVERRPQLLGGGRRAPRRRACSGGGSRR